MAVLLSCLESLTKRSVRLLITARLGSLAATFAKSGVTQGVTKTFDYGVNDQEIQQYAKRVIGDSPGLRSCFSEEEINDPPRYIQESARGIFMWAVAFLKALGENTHSSEDFHKCLLSFKEASIDLWDTVLSTVKDSKKHCQKNPRMARHCSRESRGRSVKSGRRNFDGRVKHGISTNFSGLLSLARMTYTSL